MGMRHAKRHAERHGRPKSVIWTSQKGEFRPEASRGRRPASRGGSQASHGCPCRRPVTGQKTLTGGLCLLLSADVLARLASLAVLAAGVAGCGLLTPAPPARPRATSAVAHIAYVGHDDQVYESDAAGSAARLVSVAAASDSGWSYRWPTYSPDGKRLAFAGYRSQTGGLVSAAVLNALSGQGSASILLESSVLAPIYLYWSPDSRHLTALLQRGQQLELHLLDASGAEPGRLLVAGQPLYWSWAPDGKTVAVHVGGDARTNDAAWIGLLSADPPDAREERFAEAPGGFRAPAWAPSGGKLAFVGLAGGLSMLSVRDAAGQVTRVASNPTEIAFSWSPADDWLAFASLSPGPPPLYQGLELIRPDGSERHRLTQDQLVAFYWAPDGKRLALLGVDTASRSLAWSTIQVDGKGQHALATFLPSRDFAFQLPFFDQYAQSTNVWSPDGRKLVYASEGGGERRNGSDGGERVMILDAEGQAAPASIARGSAAVWSPVQTPP
jgi:TolB protein